ncbi:MAG: hypothetical protein ACRCS8_04140 [Brevinema sp.]
MMDFRNIFNSYSTNADIAERANALEVNKAPDADVASKISEFASTLSPETMSNNSSQNTGDDSAVTTNSEPTTPTGGVSDDVLDALSGLDEDFNMDEESTATEESDDDFMNSLLNSDPDPTPNFEDEAVADSGADDFDLNFDEPATDSFEDTFETPSGNDDKFSFEDNSEDEFKFDETPADSSDDSFMDFDTDSFDDATNSDVSDSFDDSFEDISSLNNDTPAAEVPSPPADMGGDDDFDLDMSDFFDDGEGGGFNDDFEDISFNDEVGGGNDVAFDLDDDFEFGIEDPNDLESENRALSDAQIESSSDFDSNFGSDDTMSMPDFSQTDFRPNVAEERMDFTETLKPTAYEGSSQGLRDFDSWGDSQNSSALQDATSLQLSEQQIFAIREKINSFKNKETRFNLRNILLDPIYHKNYIQELISLLLIDTPEEKVTDFLKKHLDNDGFVPEYTDITEEKSFATFYAEDVLRFEQFKEEFGKILQRMSIYGVISLLMGLIVWFGFAQPLRVNSVFEKGLAELKDNNFTVAETLFNQAHEIVGEPVPKWFMKYGDEYANKKMIQVAEQKYLAGIAAAPKSIPLSVHVADFYTNMGESYYTNAIAVMKNISDLQPNKFEVWDYYGNLHIDYADFFPRDLKKQEELYFKAANIYHEFIKRNPKNMAPYYKMIDVYIKLNNESHIDFIMDLVMKANPKYLNIEVLNRLADYYINKRNLNAASRIFKKMIPFLDGHVRKIPSLQKALQKNYNIRPERITNLLAESYYEISRYKMLSSDVMGAISLLSNSIILNPSNEKSYNLMGESILAMGDGHPNRFGESELLFRKALDVNPDFYKPHINLGHLNYYWGNEVNIPSAADSTALYHYRTAKSLMPTNELNYLLQYNLSWLEHKNSNEKEALELLSDIYKNAPNNPALNYAMGSMLYKDGNPRLAQVKYQEAASLLEDVKNKIGEINYANPRHKEVFTQLSKIYNNVGVINANYGRSNPGRKDYFDSQALLNFYEAKNLADQLGNIYNITEYNIGVLTRPNVRNRTTVFDESIPKQTSLEPLHSEFKKHVLEKI